MGTFVGFSLRYLEIKKSTEKPVYKLLTAHLGLLLIEAEYAEKLAARRKEIQEILDQMDSKATSTNNNGRDLHERKDCASFKVVSSIVLWAPASGGGDKAAGGGTLAARSGTISGVSAV